MLASKPTKAEQEARAARAAAEAAASLRSEAPPARDSQSRGNLPAVPPAPTAPVLPEPVNARDLAMAGQLTFDSLVAMGVVEPENFSPDIINKDDKESLIGVPFVVVNVKFNEGDNGDFVSVEGITLDNRHIVINDGGTGIAGQAVELHERYADAEGNIRPMLIKRGLRVSRYYFDPNTKDISKKPKDGYSSAATYYLDF